MTTTPLDAVLSRLEGVKRNGSGMAARCPAHEDRRQSLSVSENEDGAVLLHCHAGCEASAVVAAIGMTLADLYPPQETHSRIVATYDYLDEAERLLYQVVRFHPKDFRQRRPDGNGGWIWKMEDTRRVLYRLPEVLAAAAAEGIVYVTEGEKDVEALEAVGIVATCNPGGVGKWAAQYSDCLRNAQVVIVADKDEPGRKHAAQVATSLKGKAASVTMVEARTGKDAAAHLAAGHGPEEFVLVDTADTSADPPSAPTDTVYTAAPLDWPKLLRDGVPPIEYLYPPYIPEGARCWIWGGTGTHKSLWSAWVAAKLSRMEIRVSYWSEENTVQEELRRLDMLRPDPAFLRVFHRTGMDLIDPQWVAFLLGATEGDAAVFLDSWTDLWTGDEGDNRAVQQFDANVLKPLQAQGCTPIVLHHTGHPGMFSTRAGASAGRGASSLGQKADVTLEFKSAGKDRFTIVYGKCRIGGIRLADRTFESVDTADGGLDIVDAASDEVEAVQALVEKMVLAITSTPIGFLTTSEVRTLVGGRRERQIPAMVLLESDPRVTVGTEKLVRDNGKRCSCKVWRPSTDGTEVNFSEVEG